MSVRNPGWYNMNAGRAYPLDDTASCLDDSGERLPSTVLVDAKLAVPASAGRYVLLSAISSTPRLLSLIFTAADTETTTAGVPVACLHIVKPVAIHRQYAVTPLLPGAGGWVAFGPDANDLLYAATFATAHFFGPSPKEFTLLAFLFYTAAGIYLGAKVPPAWSLDFVVALTFIGVPGMVFAAGGDFRYLQWAIGSVLARVLVGVFLVRVYYEREIYSPYDYMAGRLGPGVRLRARAGPLARCDPQSAGGPLCAGSGGGRDPRRQPHGFLDRRGAAAVKISNKLGG